MTKTQTLTDTADGKLTIKGPAGGLYDLIQELPDGTRRVLVLDGHEINRLAEYLSLVV